MTNAFTIPKESFIHKDRMIFLRKPRKVHQNMNPIFLLGSSKNPRPPTMKARNDKTRSE